MVLRDEPTDANFGVIPIVGMGGIGKTTLAREVFNDKAVEDFKPRAWVCVYEDFDVLRISKSILESITCSPCDLKDLNTVQTQLKEAVAGKKFLLVLDDVWSKNHSLWENLRAPFMAGAMGSRIIVTTRLQEVALTMRPHGCYKLNFLPYHDIWLVFAKHAFESIDIDSHPNLESIRQKVVQKCRGLPLAAKILGGLLRCKQQDGEWEDILNNNFDLYEESENIPAVLKLSYHHLPSHLKRCFAYCSVLPKDYEFEEEEIVFLWMAEGLIQQSKDGKQMEDLGRKYFRDLLSRSIFEKSNRNCSKFIMHDFVNDLAVWVSEESSFKLEGGLEANRQLKRFDRVRHSSYTCDRFDGKNKFKIFHNFKLLRTFLSVPMYDKTGYITNWVLSDLLPKFKRLRVLSLRRYYITELPASIGGLRHLRYLDLSYTMIRSLPQSTDSLFNLQTLILRGCSSLLKLPSSMANLINLRHFDMTDVYLITEMPLGIRQLKCLRVLSNFFVGKGVGSSLQDLKNLKFLRGRLYISSLENVIHFQDTRDAILSEKKDIEVLKLEWNSKFDDSRNEVYERDALDLLRPHKNLKELTIKCYGGQRFPSWVGDPLFSNLEVLRLEYCEKCISLPPVGQLHSLKDLIIVGMRSLKSVGFEIYGEDCSNSFQSLETLYFEDLEEWEHWDLIEENGRVTELPHLRQLSILKCPKLSGNFSSHVSSLEKLVIRECAQLTVAFASLPMLCQLEIDGCKGIEWSSPTDTNSLNSVTLSNISESGSWLRHGFDNVKQLKIVGCEELIDLLGNENYIGNSPQGLHSFTSLREICEKPPQGLQHFTFLQELCIENCSSLVQFPEAFSVSILSEVNIRNCNALTLIARGQLPSSLKRLEIQNCEKLQLLMDDREESSASSSVLHKGSIKTSLLEWLKILSCPSLTCLSSRGQLPATLIHLEIRDCPKLESIAKRFHNNTSLGRIFIQDCGNLKFIPEGLQNLNLLNGIFIFNCSSLVSFAKEGLPNAYLSIQVRKCPKLEALPNHLHSLNSLQHFEVWDCPSITSFPEKGFPTNLTSVSIVDLKLWKPLIEWGLHRLTSLTSLRIGGCPDIDAESFPEEEMGIVLPSSLIHLNISEFKKLKYLSSKGFQNLTSLESLFIMGCPNLICFPEVGLPSSLLYVLIVRCPLLKKQCKRNEGQEWSKIAHIPCIEIDRKNIYDEDYEE
ncbi:hypothetical protein ACOSP7_025814 [Xanthoceras sorbifolium]|uniref:NB-ARC domain-containing protein n=1 Tax=Xanthoceras sorbifolium TaxID=99658 RepID=A0ABQ8GWV1_9ROSI|nr:hypothetical protein JRO89_XSUnG0224500 [Xanthoceras sorbifolium]